MKYILLTVLTFFLSGCIDMTSCYSFNYHVNILVFNESITSKELTISSPETSKEFFSHQSDSTLTGKMNTKIYIGVDDNNKANYTEGWNPEKLNWVKLNFPSGERVYALLYSAINEFPEPVTEEEKSVLSKIKSLDYTFSYPENDLTKEEKLILVNYIRNLVSEGYSWAAASGTEDTELWVGDR